MAAQRDQRRLAAILAADVVGYSRLMEADEGGTLKRLKAVRKEIVDPAIAEHGGRVVKTTGDGLLAEFPSAVDAVQCAVQIQQAALLSEAANAEQPLRFRIGINLGDVIVDGDDIFGDGVNVAARVEAIADPGGVSISRTVHGLLKGDLAACFEDAGEHRVKNITDPVPVWRWTGAAAARSADPGRSGRLPTLAILPFAHGDDPELRDLADGVCDDIASIFAVRSGIRMIARSIGAETVKVANPVARLRSEHGADYVLTGTLRRGGRQARLAAELLEADSGQQIWSDRIDLDLEDVFAAQDALTERIAMAVRTAMNRKEGGRVADVPEDSLTDADHRAKAAEGFYRFSAEGFAKAARYLDIVLGRSPDDAMALSMQAFCIAFNGYHGIYPIAADQARRAIKFAERGVRLANTSDYSYAIRGLITLHLGRDPDAAIEDARLCLALQPQYAIGVTLLGEATAYAGRPEEGIPLIRKPIEADPRDPTNFVRYWMLGMAHFGAGQYEEALDAIGRGLRGQSGMPVMQLAHAAFLVKCGKSDEAEKVIGRLRRLYRKASVSTIHQPLYKDAALCDAYLDALRTAGMPD